MDDDNAIFHNDLGKVLKAMGNTEGAIKEFELAQKLDKGFEEPLINRALILIEGGDHKKAAALLEKTLKLDPENQDALYHLAEAYQVMGNTKKAEKVFKKLGMVIEVERTRSDGREIEEGEVAPATIQADTRQFKRLFQRRDKALPSTEGLEEAIITREAGEEGETDAEEEAPSTVTQVHLGFADIDTIDEVFEAEPVLEPVMAPEDDEEDEDVLAELAEAIERTPEETITEIQGSEEIGGEVADVSIELGPPLDVEVEEGPEAEVEAEAVAEADAEAELGTEVVSEPEVTVTPIVEKELEQEPEPEPEPDVVDTLEVELEAEPEPEPEPEPELEPEPEVTIKPMVEPEPEPEPEPEIEPEPEPEPEPAAPVIPELEPEPEPELEPEVTVIPEPELEPEPEPELEPEVIIIPEPEPEPEPVVETPSQAPLAPVAPTVPPPIPPPPIAPVPVAQGVVPTLSMEEEEIPEFSPVDHEVHGDFPELPEPMEHTGMEHEVVKGYGFVDTVENGGKEHPVVPPHDDPETKEARGREHGPKA